MGCDSITFAGLVSLTKNCPLLNELDLSFCWRVTKTDLKYLARECKYLEQIVGPDDINVDCQSVLL